MIKASMLLSCILLVTVGCSKVSYDKVPSSQKAGPPDASPDTFSKLDFCPELDYDFELSGKMISFELVSASNVKFGFNLLTQFFQGLQAHMQVKKAELMSEWQFSEVFRKDVAAYVQAQNKQTYKDGGIGIDFIKFGVDVGYAKQTSLAELVSSQIAEVMRKGHEKIKTLPWRAPIIKVAKNGELLVNRGFTANIKVGDTFTITPVEYDWQGEVCNSTVYKHPTATTNPVIAKVTHVESGYSYLQLETPEDKLLPIEPGDWITLAKPLQEGRKQLKKKLRFKGLAEYALMDGNSKPISFVPLFTDSIGSQASGSDYYVESDKK